MEFTLFGFSLLAILATVAGLMLGGLSKGALGLGLPVIAIPFLSLSMSVPQALVMLTIPIFTTNLWQALQGGLILKVIRRFWPMTIAMAFGIVFGTRILVQLNESILYFVIGCIVMIQPLLRVLRPDARISEKTETWLGLIVAVLAGVVGGMSGLYGPILLVYLSALRLQKDFFTASAAMFFLVGGVILGLSLAQLGVMQADDLLLSSLACLPAFAGIYLGQLIRARINQKQFERAIALIMFSIGLSLFYKAF